MALFSAEQLSENLYMQGILIDKALKFFRSIVCSVASMDVLCQAMRCVKRNARFIHHNAMQN